MKSELLERLKEISEEERLILHKNKIDKKIYTSSEAFSVESVKLMSIGKHIAIRTHTRFIDFPEHSHDYIEIMYVCSGHITHTINGHEINMSTGDFLFMNQHVSHSIKKAGENDIGINFIVLPEFFDIPLKMLKEDKSTLFADFLVDIFRKNEKTPRYMHFRTAGNTAIENLIENIISSLLNETGEENINRFTMGLIFLHIIESMDTISPDSLLNENDMIASTVLHYINTNYKNITLKELAANMHQSPSNICKIIKKATGYTFSDLLQRKRIAQAADFLTETNMTVAEIMNAVGYENSSHFYRLFRDIYGVSPREFREQNNANAYK
ncbi:MAG: helix-turn-helix domain-containing protein [Clostridia bacterium]|nr:helix-turn-helix domain-containing protein [Clostridia bacterium]